VVARKPADAESLAAILEENAAVVVRALREGSGATALGALTASLSLEGLAADATRSLVAAARAEGHTWSVIGQVLRISRQGAQKRFRKEMAMGGKELAVRGADAREALRLWSEGAGQQLVERFDTTMKGRLDARGLASAWGKVEALSGRLLTMGRPTSVQRGPHQVVDVPLAFERGPMKGRVAFDAQGKISGLFVLYPDAP
jgi:hypothetical protein